MLLKIQGSSFETLLHESIGGSALAMEVKKAEMATRDLGSRVRVSDLRTKDLLARTLDDFVRDAKKTGRGLQSLTSKIYGSVDRIMAVNEYALSIIEESAAPVSIIFSALARFSGFSLSKAEVKDAFLVTMDALSRTMERLILETEESYNDLERLEDNLSLFHEMVLREDTSIQVDKDNVLSEVWTILGQNDRKLKRIDKNEVLLKNLSVYRKQALKQVVAIQQTLGWLSADLDELRTSVAAPGVVGGEVPVEVHMKGIQAGLEQLKRGQITAKLRDEEMRRKVLETGYEVELYD